MLRAISQTCVVWREAFVERLWRDVLVCMIPRGSNPVGFFKSVGEAMRRRCEGMLESEEVAAYVRWVFSLLIKGGC